MKCNRFYGLVLVVAWTPAAACEGGAGDDCHKVCYTLTRPQTSACMDLAANSYWARKPPDFRRSAGDETVTLNCHFYRSVLGGLLPRRLRAELDIFNAKTGTVRKLVGPTIAGPTGCSSIDASDREASCCLEPADKQPVR